MPLYEYRCDNCGRTTDRFTPVDQRDQPMVCECRHVARRVMTPDVGFKMGREGLLNTRNVPNDGVHAV